MLQWLKNSAGRDALALATAIGKSQAMIEFTTDGKIIAANQNFLDAMGYRLDEIVGKNHSMFVAPGVQGSAEYRAFWAKLNRGEYQSGEFKRLGKGQREVWIQGAYNPILDADGKTLKVVKFAMDVTAVKVRSMDDAGKIAAIGRSQAVIEFNLDGTIITANDIFLSVLGYTLAEIEGKHHSLFVEPATRDSAAYREFWASLNRGEYQAAEYKRIAKGGREVWILATYNPILDDTGRVIKVVKYASDVTASMEARKSAVGAADRTLDNVQTVVDAAETMNTAALAISGLGAARHGETLFLQGDIAPGSGKDPRRATVAARWCVLAMAGDQLGDFSDKFNDKSLTVQTRRALAQAPGIAARWGAGWFLLPNPLYGPGVAGTFDDIFPPGTRWPGPSPEKK